NTLAFKRYDSIHLISLDGSGDQILVPKGCDAPDMDWSGDDTLYFMDRGLRTVDLSLNTTVVLASTTVPNSMAVTADGVALLTQIQSSEPPEVVLVGGKEHTSTIARKPVAAAFTQVTQGGAQALWASADEKTLFFQRNQVLWRCDLDGSNSKPLGAVPMSAIFVGKLSPLPWACQ
ncbi:MAG: hypothetical protein ACREKE_00470, partial [bacterium]